MIPVIENMGATLDQFDTLELCDNDICKLDACLPLRRLKCVVLNNSRVARIAEHLEVNHGHSTAACSEAHVAHVRCRDCSAGRG